jgi:hypothetical protein
MSLGLRLICEEHAYHICSHLGLDMNSLGEEGESGLNPEEIKTSLRGKRADTLNRGAEGGERVGSQSG